MAILKLKDQGGKSVTNVSDIRAFMNERGIIFEQWKAAQPLNDSDSQETILAAYEHELGPYMKKHGYLNADVINVHKDTPNVEEIRKKFLAEHTHDEDEVRFFVDGEGEFFFHLDQVFSLVCQQGDFISVPKGYKHWFDLAPKYHVKAIRVFQTKEGWVARYTGSSIADQYRA
jgi:1,2-dihydroxy-3-keto-5-methylthiopentene dioxygenase